jgi:hypothetical protein
MSETSAAAAPKSNHNANGRFAPGNSGGPGNPFAREVAELRKAILARLTVEAAGEITDALIARAKSGDVAAARLVFQYALGKPARATEPDRTPIDEMATPLGHVSAERANDLSDGAGPVMGQQTLEPLFAGPKAMDGPPPAQPSKAARKAMRRALRKMGRSPSPNGDNGRTEFDQIGVPKEPRGSNRAG